MNLLVALGRHTVVVLAAIAACAVAILGFVLIYHHQPSKPTPATGAGASAAPAPTQGFSEASAQQVAVDFGRCYFVGASVSRYLTPQERQVKALQGAPSKMCNASVTPTSEGLAHGDYGFFLNATVDGQQRAVEVFVNQAGLIDQVNQ